MIKPLALVALVASCGGHESTSSTLSNGVPAPASGALAFLPVDSELVLGFDVAAMRATPMWKRFEPRIVQSIGSDYFQVRDACGFDPLETMTYFAVGLRWVDEDHPVGVAVVRGVPPKVLDCVATEFGKAKEGGAIRDRGTVVQHESRTNLAWTMIGDALIVHIDPAAGHDSLEQIAKSGSPLQSSPAFMSLYDHLDHHAAIFGAGNGASQLLRFLGQTRPKTISGTMAITDRVDWLTHVVMPTPEAASAAKGELQNDIDKARPFVNTLDMTGSGDRFDLHLVIDGDKLDALFTLARMK